MSYKEVGKALYTWARGVWKQISSGFTRRKRRARNGIRVAALIKERGEKRTIRFLQSYLNAPWMCSTIHFEYAELLEKAKRLIEEGKLDEIPKLDKELESLELQDLFD